MLKAKVAYLLQEKVTAVINQTLEVNQNPMFELYKIAQLSNVLLKMEQEGVEKREYVDEYISSPKLTLIEKDKAHVFFSDQVSLLDIIEATAESKTQVKPAVKGEWTSIMHFGRGNSIVETNLTKAELERNIQVAVFLNEDCINFHAFKKTE